MLLGGSWVGLARTIHLRCMYSIFGREFIEYRVMYSVYIQFWPTLIMHASFSLINVGSSFHCLCVGMARTMYIRCIYGIFGREFITYTVIYGVYIYVTYTSYTANIYICIHITQAHNFGQTYSWYSHHQVCVISRPLQSLA